MLRRRHLDLLGPRIRAFVDDLAIVLQDIWRHVVVVHKALQDVALGTALPHSFKEQMVLVLPHVALADLHCSRRLSGTYCHVTHL
jgi:hypothetical protein